jgi:hypothetical protein
MAGRGHRRLRGTRRRLRWGGRGGAMGRCLWCHEAPQARSEALRGLSPVGSACGERAGDAARVQRGVPKAPQAGLGASATGAGCRALSRGGVCASAQVPAGTSREAGWWGREGARDAVSRATLARQASGIARQSYRNVGQGCGGVTRHPGSGTGRDLLGKCGVDWDIRTSGAAMSRATLILQGQEMPEESGRKLEQTITRHPPLLARVCF